jgi:uncharacterized membrane-anchored protein YhcB (DUF1043 family)
MSLVEFDCPECGKPLRVNVEDSPSSQSLKKPILITIIAVGGIAILWAIIATLVDSSHRRQLRASRYQLQDVKQNITKFEDEAENHLAEAKRQAKMIADADKIKKDAEGIILRDKNQMHEVFGNLHRYTAGHNQVNQRYVASFSISGEKAKVRLANKSSLPIKPDMTIRLVNRYGFITETIWVNWLINKIQPGETRIEEKFISLHFGEPVYYQVIF